MAIAKHTMTELLRQAISAAESIRAVAKATELDHASLVRFVNGDASLRLDLADRLAEYFGISCTAKNPPKRSQIMRTKMSDDEKSNVVYALLRDNPGVEFDIVEIRNRTGVTKSFVDRNRALSRRSGVTRYEANRKRGVRWAFTKG